MLLKECLKLVDIIFLYGGTKINNDLDLKSTEYCHR